MKITEIKIQMGRTINTGNYESLRIDVEMAARLDENDDVRETTDNLRATVKLELSRLINLETQKRKKAEDYF